MEAVRVGMIGAGGVAARHVRSLLAIGVEVVGVTDVDRGRAVDLANSFGTSVAEDAADLLHGFELDAVYICVPPFAHGDPEKAAISAGVPFFVEKPLALDVATAESIGGQVAAAGLLTATGYHWRYYDTVERVASLVAERPVRMALAMWLDKVPPVPWWAHRSGSGGQIVEQATHVLDLLRILVGEVVEVHAVGARFRESAGDVDDAAVATLRFSDGAIGSLIATSLLSGKHRTGVELYGDGYSVWLDEESTRWSDGEVDEWSPTVDARSAADQAFIEAVRTGEPSLVKVPYGEALRTHRLACAVADACAGRPVDLTIPAP